jgi:ubiquinone/menaquinone biosynthesis C-methylase UbiE
MANGRNRVAEKYVEQMLNELRSLAPAPRLLIIGGGGVGDGAAALYEDDRVRVIGTDIYRSTHTTVVADGHQLPFTDESVDGVWIQAVLEHVLDPAQVVAEIHRVLRKDGVVFANTPFMQQVHEGAYDFTRFTLSGHRWLFRNFDLLEAGTSAGAGVATIWSLRYLVRVMTGSNKLATLAAAACWWLRLVDYFFDNRNAADAASGVYFYGRKSCASIAHQPACAQPQNQPAFCAGEIDRFWVHSGVPSGVLIVCVRRDLRGLALVRDAGAVRNTRFNWRCGPEKLNKL